MLSYIVTKSIFTKLMEKTSIKIPVEFSKEVVLKKKKKEVVLLNLEFLENLPNVKVKITLRNRIGWLRLYGFNI